MDIKHLSFPDAWLERTDVEAVRTALRSSTCSWPIATDFAGAHIHDLLEDWRYIVTTDWHSGTHDYEYEYDLDSRGFLQLILEVSSPATRARLEKILSSLDDLFKARMRPLSAGRQRVFPLTVC